MPCLAMSAPHFALAEIVNLLKLLFVCYLANFIDFFPLHPLLVSGFNNFFCKFSYLPIFKILTSERERKFILKTVSASA